MKRSSEKEMMDLPGQPKELLADDLRNLRIINRYLGCYRNVLRGLARLVGEQKLHRFTLLDVGTGSGDIPTVIAHWARRQQIAARITGLEREAATVEEAVDQTRSFPEITIVRGDATAPPFGAGSFDFVLTSQLLHHFKDEQIIVLLRTWARLARRGIIVSDLVRHPVAYHGIRLLTKGFTRNTMTRTDAPLSVQRACTISEWQELFRRADVGRLRVQWMFPFRVLALISPKR
ncbi:MAG TPA: methyltransferase domain-containing protein [Candidatus Binatia bacterium]|jgi:ubiquinone/menaquinone biosynthesis C-methylase UbiE